MAHSRSNQQYFGYGVPFQSLTAPFVPDGTLLTDDSLPDFFSLLNISQGTYAETPSFHHNTLERQMGSGEGFGHSLNNLGVNGFFDRQRWCEEMEAEIIRGHCSSAFDFDQKSKLLYSTPQFETLHGGSSSFATEIADKKLKFQRIDDYEQQSPCCSSRFQSESESHNQDFQFMSLWCLKELRGRIYTMAKDQNGCRILQAMLERSTMEEVEIVVSEVVDFVSHLMKDQFGNYLFQKLVTLCNDDQKLRLIRSLTQVPTGIILVCMNPHGTRSVQKLLESLNPNQVKLVMKALYRGATTLATDPNGHHVIQYCVINFDSDMNKPILNEIANKCYTIATDRSGCCVLQACVEHSRGEVRTRIITEIIVNAVPLAEDPFGNYVLQHMVGLKLQELTALLVRRLQGNFAALSCNKYASNVVEKCLNESGEEVSTKIIMELVKSPNSSMLLVDPYANFVIQSALRVSKGFGRSQGWLDLPVEADSQSFDSVFPRIKNFGRYSYSGTGYRGSNAMSWEFILATGNSRAVISIWNPSIFSVSNTVKHKKILLVSGIILGLQLELNIVNVCAPQSNRDKSNMWSEILGLMDQCLGLWIVAGDFNEVRCPEDRLFSAFDVKGAESLMIFVDEAGLMEYRMGGSRLTFSYGQGINFNKIDRILVCNDFSEVAQRLSFCCS
ncbi:hypothetical protein SSX86_007738 [Deinandra increscens subsp. villosa]|uniref:PUM-HD domain-containing protein n=1 Tax=Deinandra increscens subsp. villosa TaxID=3103831 RepID=A0AAP0DEF1_9ASTR